MNQQQTQSTVRFKPNKISLLNGVRSYFFAQIIVGLGQESIGLLVWYCGADALNCSCNFMWTTRLLMYSCDPSIKSLFFLSFVRIKFGQPL